MPDLSSDPLARRLLVRPVLDVAVLACGACLVTPPSIPWKPTNKDVENYHE